MSISLRDLAPMRGSVTIRGQDFELHGVSGVSINNLLSRFSELRKIMVERGSSLTTEEMLRFVPDAVFSLIAEARIPPAANEQEEAVRRLSVLAEEEGARKLVPGEVADCLDVVINLSFPRGTGPFVEMLQRYGVVSKSVAVAPATAPEKSDGIGKVPDTKSVSQSNGSSDSATVASL